MTTQQDSGTPLHRKTDGDNSVRLNPTGSVSGCPAGPNIFIYGSAILLGFSMMCLSSCGQLSQSSPAGFPPGSSGVASEPVVLGEGDVVRLFFQGASEYNTSQKIRTDGKISLPIIGEVQAAGKTLKGLQADLSSRYKSQLINSDVVASLDASGKPVILSGGLASPGKILLERPTTLLEAIMGAGGFTDFARRKKVRIIRLVNGQYHTEEYDMSGAVTGKPTPVVYLKGGDVVYVPRSNW